MAHSSGDVKSRKARWTGSLPEEAIPASIYNLKHFRVKQAILHFMGEYPLSK